MLFQKLVIFNSRIYLWLILSVINVDSQLVLADEMQKSFDLGEQYKNHLQLGDPNKIGNKVIFDKDADVSHLSNLTDQELVIKGAGELNNSEAGKLVEKSAEAQVNGTHEYKINGENPLFKNALKIESDPLKLTKGDNYQVSESTSKVRVDKNCLEGVNFEIDVIRQLILESELVNELGDWQDRSMQITPSDIQPSWSKQLVKEVYYNKDNWSRATYTAVREEDTLVQVSLKKLIAERLWLSADRIGSYATVGYDEKKLEFSFHIDTVPEIARLNYKFRDSVQKFKEKGEYWQVINEETEKLVEEANCYEINHKCLENGNKVFFDKYTVNRPCWKEQVTYACGLEPIDGCKHLWDQGCKLDHSVCHNQVGRICLQWQRHFRCLAEQKEMRSSIKNNSMFCLGGDCHTPTIEQNLDIHNVGYLAMLNEMKKDMQGSPIQVFKGEANKCNKFIVSFLNCCSSMKGWGKDLGLGKCKGEEKALALKKDKGLCHYVGTYCAEKDPIFNQCLRKKTVYCCFGSLIPLQGDKN